MIMDNSMMNMCAALFTALLARFPEYQSDLLMVCEKHALDEKSSPLPRALLEAYESYTGRSEHDRAICDNG
jgi:hypothetical protein